MWRRRDQSGLSLLKLAIVKVSQHQSNNNKSGCMLGSVYFDQLSRIQIRLRLHLNPHHLEQRLDLHNRKKRPIILERLALFQMPYQMLKVTIHWSCDIDAQLVHLI